MTSKTNFISWIVSFAVLLIISGCKKKGDNVVNTISAVDSEITVDETKTFQTIRGFGCATVFNPPNTTAYTEQEFDRLFGSGQGQVGLTILRIRLASDETWRSTELNHAKWAVQRGAKVFASPWSPPARMKTNGNIIGGKLLWDSAANYAKYLNDFALYMSTNGVPLEAVSVQNEPDWEPSYESCVWTATEMRDFLKNHGSAITATKLMAPELVNNNQGYVNTILSDPGAVANLDILGTHIYGGGIIENSTIKSLGREIWMTEHLDTLTSWEANMNTAVEIHECLTKANFSAYIWWYGKRFYGPLGQSGLVTPRGFVISQFARFIKPGSIRINTSANTINNVLVSAYKNAGKKVIVIINLAGYDVKQKITIQGGANSTTYVPHITGQNKNAEQGAIVSAAGNVLTSIIPSKSIVTLVEN